MTSRLLAGALVAAALTFGTGASAQSGSTGVFTVYNDTTNNVITGFYTNDGSGWSNDWMNGEILSPGEAIGMTFYADSGPCDQNVIVGWFGNDGSEVQDEPIYVNICEASNLYLGDNEIYFD